MSLENEAVYVISSLFINRLRNYENVTLSISRLMSSRLLIQFFQDFIDPIVRCWAIMQLDKYSDAQLEELLLQIVHLLKYEPYHDITLSPDGETILGRMNLPRFLLQRSMRNRRFGMDLTFFVLS